MRDGHRLAATGLTVCLSLGLPLVATPAAAVPPSPSASSPAITVCHRGATRFADQLVDEQRYAAAQELYRATLRGSPRDRCAQRGMAAVAQARAAAAKKAADKAEKGKTLAERFSAHWSALLKHWLTPAGDLVLPVLGALLLLLVLARLLTPALVPVTASGWTRPARRWCWWGGFVAVCLAALAPVAAGYVTHPWIPWAVGAVLAVAGVLALASARGRELRLQVDVTGVGGSADANATQDLLAALMRLGSRPPRGLDLPNVPDVSALPADALTTLPQGRVVVVLLKVLRAARGGVPWRASVSLLDDDRATLALTRNGRSYDDRRSVDRTRWGLPAVSTTATPPVTAEQAKAQTLLAAAAYVLVCLSERHAELRKGLCGATSWESVAQQALAGAVPSADGRLRRQLLGDALNADPCNDLARLGLAQATPEGPDDLDGQLRYARTLDAHYRLLFPPAAPEGTGGLALQPAAGYEALELRLLYARAATWLNVVALLGQGTGEVEAWDGRVLTVYDAWRRAGPPAAGLCLRVEQLDRDEEKKKVLVDLLDEMRPTATFVRDFIEGQGYGQYLVATAAPPADRAAPERLRRIGLFDRVCSVAAATDPAPADLLDVLPDLELVATNEDWRQWMRVDPALATFRQPGTAARVRAEFQRIVGDPPATDLLTLPPFTDHADGLRKAGLADAAALAEANPGWVAERLEVHPSLARTWREIAVLGRTLAGDGPVPVGDLHLLELVNVTTVEALRARLVDDAAADALLGEIVAAGTDLAVAPTRANTVDVWRERLLAGA